ncbi:radical SAM protein [Herpetosiphon sp. NSE202]|uniref:B12-binding domain-containing radical SAM protein n=1 Tax=Herpetosiphon sp. NSE202 TaxID=3351349 RepID=UPI00363D9C0C
MLKIVLLQLPVPSNPAANVPLAAGYLKAWAYQQGLLERMQIEIVPRDIADRGGDGLICDWISAQNPHVLGISLYTWNSERSLQLASLLKKALPRLIVVVGGPEVQRNNAWVLEHSAIDIAVEGEGEQTFSELLLALEQQQQQISLPMHNQVALPYPLVAGTLQYQAGQLHAGLPRPAMGSLDPIPSPYLLGFLELRAGEIAFIECSRWCPYSCTFCLYGRNLGTKLGGRMFGSERVLAEVAWARQRGARAIHFVEANLNLLPNFRELMRGLHTINQPEPTPIYAELRGEHLKPESVEAMVQAGLTVAEVGLQSANRTALQAVGRRTDLDKWAEGTRRLYQHDVAVLLDVILGLPEDDAASTHATIEWIQQQQLGDYDIFTLQVLPGTGVRNEAERFGMQFQLRPPYYILANNWLNYQQLRALRWDLREQAGLDPLAIEGMPQPPSDVWLQTCEQAIRVIDQPIRTIVLDCRAELNLEQWQAQGQTYAQQVASHVVVVAKQSDLAVLEAFCWPIAQANLSIHWDIVLDQPLAPNALRQLQQRWPHSIGYLDRIAVYRRWQAEPDWLQVTPRWWINCNWREQLDPLSYEGIAEVVWRVPADQANTAIPALNRRGGTGIVLEAEHVEPAWQALSEHLPILAPLPDA